MGARFEQQADTSQSLCDRQLLPIPCAVGDRMKTENIDLSPATLARLKRLQLVAAFAGDMAFIVLALYWFDLGYTVAGFIALAAAFGWTAGLYPEPDEKSK
jgi:hypothetical protein